MALNTLIPRWNETSSSMIRPPLNPQENTMIAMSMLSAYDE